MVSLLPSNASDLERVLETVFRDALANIEGSARLFYQPEQCPADLLPWLGWSVSVDEWSDQWTEQQRRNAIADAISDHRRKGSRLAVENALQRFGASVVLREWWQYQPALPVHTFTIDIVGGSSTGSSITDLEQIKRLVDSKKPLRSHYTITVGTELNDGINLTGRCVPVIIFRGNF